MQSLWNFFEKGYHWREVHIVVTGSSGTIGTRLCERLLRDGHAVTGADWERCKWNDDIENIRIHTDLRDEKSIDKLPADAEMVIHLAANARVYELVEHPDRARDNFLTLFNALEYARKNGIKKFMFASSREAYGNIPAESYTEEMAQIRHCESPYTASKIGGEALVHSYASCYGIDFVTFRFSNVYGMYDDSVRVVPLFIRQARANEPMTVFGADKYLDFTYIDDCVDGIVATVDNFDAVKNEVYNLAFGQGTSILTLAERVKELIGSTSEIRMTGARTGEVIRYIANISKAKAAFGYDPRHSFEDGIRRAVEWYLQNT